MITPTAGVSPGIEQARPVTPVERSDNKTEENSTAASIAAKLQEAAEARKEEPVVDRQAAAETLARAMFTEFPANASLEIDVNDHDDGFIYKAVDRDTGEVIKQFPAAEVLDRLERMSKVQGLAVDGTV